MSSDLLIRRLMIIQALKILHDDDKVHDDAIAHYERQLADIDEKIRQEKDVLARMNNSGNETVITLKPGIIQIGHNKEQNG